MSANDNELASAVERYETALLELRRLIPRRDPNQSGDVGCSFCCRPLSEVRDRVLGANVSICDRCVATAFELLKERGTLERAT